MFELFLVVFSFSTPPCARGDALIGTRAIVKCKVRKLRQVVRNYRGLAVSWIIAVRCSVKCIMGRRAIFGCNFCKMLFNLGIGRHFSKMFCGFSRAWIIFLFCTRIRRFLSHFLQIVASSRVISFLAKITCSCLLHVMFAFWARLLNLTIRRLYFFESGHLNAVYD